MKMRRSVAALVVALIGLSACNQPGQATPVRPAPTRAVLSTVTPAAPTMPVASATPAPTPLSPTATPMMDWQAVRPGVEYLRLMAPVAGNVDWVSMVRVDPRVAQVRVRYAPDQARSVRDWFESTGADVVINAGFFTPEKKATGLLIADGQSFGQTYRGFGGMLAVRNDGRASLQWLAKIPYAADRAIRQAVQSFPMLVLDGRVIDSIPDDGERNRRSFVGLDGEGRLIFGICHNPMWTLTDLAQLLATHRLLSIRNALNLDGGASSGLWLRGVSEPLLMDSLETVPAVISVVSDEK